MCFRPALLLALSALACARLIAGPTPASAEPFPAPKIPKNALAYWSSEKTKLQDGELTVLDTVGGNDFSAAGWVTAKPGAGIFFDGTQSTFAKTIGKQVVAPNFCLTLDLMPSASGAEFQTPVYLFGFCELRYRSSRSELSFVIWQKDVAGDSKVSGSVKLPIVAGKWNRVQAVIQGNTAHLTVNGVTTGTTLENSWESLSDTKALMFGFGGSDRPYQGGLDHLLITHTP